MMNTTVTIAVNEETDETQVTHSYNPDVVMNDSYPGWVVKVINFLFPDLIAPQIHADVRTDGVTIRDGAWSSTTRCLTKSR